jgi:hypothetical protein
VSIKDTVLAIGDSTLTRDEFQTIHSKVKTVLGSDAANAFSDAVTCEADQFFVEEPESLPMLWRRLHNLAKSEGKV